MNNYPAGGNSILLVEDEESLAIGLKFNLSEEGYEVDWVPDGRKALEYIGRYTYDLVLLDIMLPYVDGFEVAEQIRVNDPQMPILILTARTGAQDRIKGLASGADDYLAKPFHLQELLLRVKGMLKRKNWYKKAADEIPRYRIGSADVNFDNLTCNSGGDVHQLTVREAMVMKYLIENRGKVVSRKELLENVWSISSDIETRTIDNFIARLRKYIEPDPANPVHIKSVRGSGYIFSD
jgi:two-component system alkaline phosphatase synthesis response regulator PhoP